MIRIWSCRQRRTGWHCCCAGGYRRNTWHWHTAVWHGTRRAIVWTLSKAGWRKAMFGVIILRPRAIGSWRLLTYGTLWSRCQWRACRWCSRCSLLHHPVLASIKQAATCTAAQFRVNASAAFRAVMLMPCSGNSGWLLVHGSLWGGLWRESFDSWSSGSLWPC